MPPKISIVIPSLPGYDELNATTCEEFRKTAPDTKLEIILSVDDVPFAVNVNRGLKKVEGEIIVISNNDVIPLPGWSEYLLNRASHPGIISFTPRADCGWGFGITREVFEAVGYLDETLINSYEDYDYFIRAANSGYTRLLADKYYLLHEGGHTLNSLWGTYEEQRAERLAQCKANREYMQQKWPGIQIDAVPLHYWAINGIEIMKEYQSGKVSSR